MTVLCFFAIIFTLIESAKRHGLEPHAYQCERLHRLPQTSNQEIEHLTPAALAKTRAGQNQLPES